MADKQYRFQIAVSAQRQYDKAIKKRPEKREKVRKAVKLMETYGPSYPSFRTHMLEGVKAESEPIYISYIENNTPSAWRIHWSWWGDNKIVALYVGPHP
ncbi:hypothetical protein HMPREF3011_08915 [Corynebacterium sp. HMSC074C04]|uniref:hypothetical protein n=1 Tax=unclassified Corynebacterium TaxID=2624378 RepID=UPI0008A61649|nr:MULTISPECIES: hypothetical protein [unclassified Corynebacterium]OFR92566.1 hypothetical protein HMPREF2860_07525 [Corynebacterium sp. HMSC064E10]OHR31934.1 hypothetical protein HMPREF3011_08915 [Corynebacterium sp. HMSC074C04]